MPRGQDHEGREEREHEQGDPEPDVRAARLAAAFDSRPAAGALAAVRKLDREGIEGRRAVVDGRCLVIDDGCEPGVGHLGIVSDTRA